jgi:hypothetical protein
MTQFYTIVQNRDQVTLAIDMRAIIEDWIKNYMPDKATVDDAYVTVSSSAGDINVVNVKVSFPDQQSLEAFSDAHPIFKEDEILSLNEYQTKGRFHPFTCGTKEKHKKGDGENLVASKTGWSCPHCDYRQFWAHEFMKDWSWKPAGDDPFGMFS